MPVNLRKIELFQYFFLIVSFRIQGEVSYMAYSLFLTLITKKFSKITLSEDLVLDHLLLLNLLLKLLLALTLNRYLSFDLNIILTCLKTGFGSENFKERIHCVMNEL